MRNGNDGRFVEVEFVADYAFYLMLDAKKPCRDTRNSRKVIKRIPLVRKLLRTKVKRELDGDAVARGQRAEAVNSLHGAQGREIE